jgi:hypothetical protein
VLPVSSFPSLQHKYTNGIFSLTMAPLLFLSERIITYMGCWSITLLLVPIYTPGLREASRVKCRAQGRDPAESFIQTGYDLSYYWYPFILGREKQVVLCDLLKDTEKESFSQTDPKTESIRFKNS